MSHNNHKVWSKEETDYIIANYERLGAVKIAKQLGRTQRAMHSRVYELRKHGFMPQHVVNFNEIKLHKTKHPAPDIAKTDDAPRGQALKYRKALHTIADALADILEGK